MINRAQAGAETVLEDSFSGEYSNGVVRNIMLLITLMKFIKSKSHLPFCKSRIQQQCGIKSAGVAVGQMWIFDTPNIPLE